jgi:hypothetical protein
VLPNYFPMHFDFIKAVQFSLLIKTGGRLREFNFRKLKVPDQEVMAADVCTERGERVFFNLHKSETGWEITTENLPAWIEQFKKNIHQAVDEEMLKWR